MSVNKSEELILTVYTYFENSIFVREKDDSVKEHFVRDSKGYFGAFIAKGKVDDQLKYIESKVKDKTLSDVVGVVIYQMFMNKIDYENLHNLLPTFTDEQLILDIFKKNMTNEDSILCRGFFPLVFRDRISVFNYKS